jgi:hypothetical protein
MKDYIFDRIIATQTCAGVLSQFVAASAFNAGHCSALGVSPANQRQLRRNASL